jgi:hypothetical protein
MIPIGILQLDSLEELLRVNNLLTDEKRKMFQEYKQALVKLREGGSFGDFTSSAGLS